MAPRVDARVNVIVDAVVALIAGIDASKDGTKWLSTVKTAKRRLMLGDLTMLERPAVVVIVGKWEDKPQGPTVHETTLYLELLCIVDGGDDADARMQMLASDVIRAITDDESLKTNVLFMSPASYVPELEVMSEISAGAATITLPLRYNWSHGAP